MSIRDAPSGVPPGRRCDRRNQTGGWADISWIAEPKSILRSALALLERESRSTISYDKSLVFLFKVEASLAIPGRSGAYIFPGLPFQNSEMPRVRVNDKIQLRTPTGNIIDTYIAGIEHAKTKDGSRYPIQLPHQMTKEDIPPGTEIWLI